MSIFSALLNPILEAIRQQKETMVIKFKKKGRLNLLMLADAIIIYAKKTKMPNHSHKQISKVTRKKSTNKG